MQSNWDCYILVLQVNRLIEVHLRGLKITLNPGMYFYVGSGKGAGGALARLIRHLSGDKQMHWHIDQLTSNKHVEIKGFYLVRSGLCDCESSISQGLINYMDYVEGFGSTDKPRDKSHLFKCMSELEVCLHRVYMIIENDQCLVEATYAST
ncbi:MAG: GIY-YIG nuclease family protein [Desulfurococcaceae archaeon]